MKKLISILLTAALVAAIPLAAAAQHDHGKKKPHGTHGKKMDHGAGHEDMMMIGEQSVAGVKGMAHLNDVREAMAKMKMKETHHFMVLFMDEASGAPIEEGTAAVRITGPDGQEGSPVRLIAMDGHFGADVVLDKQGNYTFVVGTRLPDGQTRQFEFTHMLH
jgi:hypothetical protein